MALEVGGRHEPSGSIGPATARGAEGRDREGGGLQSVVQFSGGVLERAGVLRMPRREVRGGGVEIPPRGNSPGA